MPTMKAWQASAYGAEGNPGDTIASLELKEVEIPPLGPGQLLVKVDRAAVNPIDWKLFSGGLHGVAPCTFPYVSGFDITGTVSALGEGRLRGPRRGVSSIFETTRLEDLRNDAVREKFARFLSYLPPRATRKTHPSADFRHKLYKTYALIFAPSTPRPSFHPIYASPNSRSASRCARTSGWPKPASNLPPRRYVLLGLSQMPRLFT